jgi:DNA polymerase-3 subunit epsilon
MSWWQEVILSMQMPDLITRPLSQATLVFVDVETTGLHPEKGDRVCEIALIRQEPGQSEQEFVSFVDPERTISPDAFAVNKITPEMLAGAPKFPKLYDRVAMVLSGAVLVAHNAPFDLGFLRSEYARCGQAFPDLPVLDTLALARRRFHFVSNSLSAVARQLDVKQPRRKHRALADCRTTQRILDAMVRATFGNESPTLARVIGLTELPFVPVEDLSELGSRVPPPILEMIRQDRELRIIYVSKDGQKTARPIRVKQVVRLGQQFYLVAQCLIRNEERHFRIDRIINWRADVAAATDEEGM